MADKCTGWAIVATMERTDKTWYTETITDIDDSTASIVDDFLTEYCEQKEHRHRLYNSIMLMIFNEYCEQKEVNTK
jgi:hypothetical protein